MKTRHRSTRRWHRWLAGILGIQLTLWIVSGVYFSWVPIDTVRGTDLHTAHSPALLDTTTPYLDTQVAITHYADSFGEFPTTVTLRNNLHTPYFALYGSDTQHPRLLVDALSGAIMPQLDTHAVNGIAERSYGDHYAHAATTLLLDEAPDEYRGPLPVYQVQLADWRGTRMYISPVDGHILAHRNHFWRVFDFFWMLHIMDFDERTDFNNPVLRIFATTSLSIIVTGYGLWWYRRRQRQRAS